jgi:hypothetical protein
MTVEVKILVDECVGKKFVKVMNDVLTAGEKPAAFEALHAFMGRCGAKDAEWIRAAAREGYTVVSVDRGKSSGDKLPLLCQALRVKHFLMSSTIKNRGSMGMAMALLGTWFNFNTACEESHQLRYMLKLTTVGGKQEVGPHRHGLYRQAAGADGPAGGARGVGRAGDPPPAG